MSVTRQAPGYIRAISPYAPGKPITEIARELGLPLDRIVKIATNENPRGMSAKSKAAAAAAIADIERYPDQYDLTAKLADHFGMDAAQIILGNGSNDVLDLVARAFLAPGRSAVMSEHAFAVYPLATQSAGGTCIVVPAVQFGHDLTAMGAAIREDTRVVWIANPNNPTGTLIASAAIDEFLAAVPPEVVVVLDQAYLEYLPPSSHGDALVWLRRFPNLLVTRTFSKAHGLAGLRIGYGLTSEPIADLLHRVRQPFNVNNVALAAAAAALDDHLFVAESYEMNHCGMEQIVAGIKHLGLEHIPSHGNFVSVRVGDAAAVNDRLLRQGVIVRPIAGYGLPEHLRITVGLEWENARFLQALASALK